MLFSSIPFLFYFLPIVLALYFAVPKKLKNTVLLLSSLFFYGWGEPKFLIFMLISITQGYVFGLLIEKFRGMKLSKVFLVASVLLSLSLLVYCKYTDFFIENFNALTGMSVPLLGIVLPIGISFYTFQILSYSVDVYRGDTCAQRNFINLAAYVAMFPQLIAGPIVRYSDIAKQLENRNHSFEKAALGVRRFVTGLSKKILLANILGELVAIFKASEEKSVLFFWMYAIAYILHVYFDFSGYSDMAIGLGKIFGFDFLENFNYPYISASITEFWRRWHMSLGSWFRDYLYIPMGGNRVSKPRFFFNIFVVWMATGFWHGAEWTFILWGIYFAILLIIEKVFLLKQLKKTHVLSHIYVLIFVLMSFVLFDAATPAEAIYRIGSLFGAGGHPLITAETIYYLRSFAVLLIISAVGSTPLPSKIYKTICKKKTGNSIMTVAEPLILTILLVVCTAFLIDGSFNPFLYFRF
ncbi:MAG: MBOAT family protein [Ruminococcaceae bacterium]|nr:MBOAT family protein [Oscillospiraceae bacterium]